MPKDQINSQDKLLDLGLIHAEQLIKAIEKRVPQPNQRARLMATIVAEEKRKDAKPESAWNLMYWIEDYKDRLIEIPSLQITGVMTDAKRVPDTRLVSIVIDSTVHIVNGDTSSWVYPKAAVETKSRPLKSAYQRAQEASRINDESRGIKMPAPIPWVPTSDTEPNSLIQTTLSTLAANIKQYRGYVVDFDCGRELRGVVTDVYAYTSMPNWYYVVVDGRIHCMGGGNAIAIEMPRAPRKKIYVVQSAEAVYKNRHNLFGKEIFIKDAPHVRGILSDASQSSKYVVVLILDGKIINFSLDAELSVEL